MDLLAVLLSIGMIAVLIIVHEFGHFLAAKYYGFQTPVFGIGLPFGPSIDLFKRWGTQFKFYFALIGGFVAIPELGDETDPEMTQKYPLERELREFPASQRIVVASAGIVFNIIFAFLLAIIMAGSIGLPKGIASNQINAFINDESVAKIAGLKLGDKIVQVNDMETSGAKDLQLAIKKYTNQEITLLIDRPLDLEDKNTDYKRIVTKLYSPGALGIILGSSKTYVKSGANPLQWIVDAFKFTAKTFFAMLLSVVALFAALFDKIIGLFTTVEPSAVSLGEVKGIVGIVQIISEDVKSNAYMLLEFAVLLNLNLAVINLLPIPALDGGHILFMTYELITGKKPHEKFQENAVQFGFVFLLSIIVLTTFNDIKNWIF